MKKIVKKKAVPLKNVVDKKGEEDSRTGDLAKQYKITGNRWWQELREYIDTNRSAGEAVPLLLLGPTGTGKGLLARNVHHGLHKNWGDGNPEKPFVHVNCALLNKDRMEDQLFGHVKDAFTDATSDQDGYFQRAKSGTLFLDEFQELTPDVLGGLLTAIEEHRVWKMRAKIENFDILNCTTILGSTRDLSLEQNLRPDMYYRISQFTIHMHPLVNRGADLLVLVRRFIEEFGPTVTGVTADLLLFLMTWSWPGNVRELRNVLWRLCKTSTFLNGRLLSMEALIRDQSLRLLSFGVHDSVPGRDEYTTHWSRIVAAWQRERKRLERIMPKVSKSRCVIDLGPAYLRLIGEKTSSPDGQFTLPRMETAIDQLPAFSANDIAAGDHSLKTHKERQVAVSRWVEWTSRLKSARNLVGTAPLPQTTLSASQPAEDLDVPFKEATENFRVNYFKQLFRRFPDKNDTELAHICGADRGTVAKYRKLLLRDKPAE